MDQDLCPNGTKAVAERRKAPKILCVDDDPNVSEAIARAFSRHGVEVIRAFHGMQGFWLASTEKPDAIVLDLAMPKGPGEEVLECLKRNAQTARIPVIVLTGKSNPGLERHMQRLGADRFLVKPTPADTLLAEISSLLDRLV
ncbi:MAG: response regulator [Thermoguttaceae bacterium]|jgi:DNA-binding response OmpR family regulator|nr:response regulator [Thermoguttaceae bacterium]